MKVKKIIIPIAGHGTRMFPASKTIPKALFPIFDPTDQLCKPVLLFVLQQVLLAYPKDEQAHVQFCIILSPFQVPLLQQFFSEEANDHVYASKQELNPQLQSIRDLAKRVTFVVQEKQEGFGHAILCAQEWIAQDPFVILLGDHVFKSYNDVNCVRQVLNVYEQFGKSCLGVTMCKEQDIKLYGIMRATLDTNVNGNWCGPVTSIKEKPSLQVAQAELVLSEQECALVKKQLPEYASDAYKYLKVFGIYCFTPDIIQILQTNYKNKQLNMGELQLTDSIRGVSETSGLLAVVMQGKTYDTGIPSAYTDTILAFSKE